MQKHALLTLLGLVLAALTVAWIRPNTIGGTAFVVVVSVLLVNAIGAIAIRPRKVKRRAPKARVAVGATVGRLTNILCPAK
jgi:hypothetical protein